MSIVATYVDIDTFTIATDLTADFMAGRRIKADCGNDGYKYGTILSSSYSSPNTTVNLTAASDDLTDNLISVEFGIIGKGVDQSMPEHIHSGDEGTGGTIDHGALTGRGDDDHSQYLLTDTWKQNGFPNRTDSTISFSNSTMTFTIAPIGASFDYYIDGAKYTVTSGINYQITDTEGLWIFYFDDETLTAVNDPSDSDMDNIFLNQCSAALLYWDATNNLGSLAEERHGINMAPQTHAWLHNTIGASYKDGLGVGNITADGNGDLDIHAQFSVEAGAIYDEDIEHSILFNPLASGTKIWYRDGTDWKYETNPGFSVLTAGTGRLAYDDEGVVTEVANKKYSLYHVFTSNFVDYEPFTIMGQAQYINISSARLGANEEISAILSLPLPSLEMKVIGTIIFQTDTAYNNAVKSRIVTTDIGGTYVDWRITPLSPSVPASDHGLLAGLADDDHLQYHNDARGDDRYYTEAEVDTISGTLQDQIGELADHSTLDNLDYASANHTGFSPDTHIHDDRYYTEAEVDTISGTLNDKIDAIDYYTTDEIDTISGSLSSEIDSDITTHEAGSSHDSRYYTETEIDTISGTLRTDIDTKIGSILEDTTPQLGGNLDLNYYNVDYGIVLTSSGTYEGEIITATIDDSSVVFGDALYQVNNFHYEKTDASSAGTMPCTALALESGSGSKKIFINGQICNTDWNWNSGNIYISATISGGLTQIKPFYSADIIHIIGWSLSADTMFLKIPTLEIPIVGDRGVFGGGYASPTFHNIIDYITISIPSFAIDFGDLTVGRRELAATSNGINERGVFAGGNTGSYVNIIDYITISIFSNAADFGDLTTIRANMVGASNGINERGVFGGGTTGVVTNIIDYITISSIGNAIDFGDLTIVRQQLAACSNGTNERGIFGGGNNGAVLYNTIDYITISSTGNATDFGDLNNSIRLLQATSNGTNERGVFGGGYNDVVRINVIDYITISSTGNATDFGDLTVARSNASATSNGVDERGVFGGGVSTVDTDIIDYITISTLGNAIDFGDLTVTRSNLTATSNA